MHIYHVQPSVVLLEVLTYRLRSGKKIPGAFSLDFLPWTPWEGPACREHKVFHVSGRSRGGLGKSGLMGLWGRVVEEGFHEVILKKANSVSEMFPEQNSRRHSSSKTLGKLIDQRELFLILQTHEPASALLKIG